MGERWCGGRGKVRILGVRKRNCVLERRAKRMKLQLCGMLARLGGEREGGREGGKVLEEIEISEVQVGDDVDAP